MLILKDRLQNIPVMSLQTGARIAETSDFIIDPRQLKIVAFYCRGPRLDVNPAVLVVNDIREMSNIGFIVDSADVLVAPSDLVRLKEVITFNFVLENKKVVDDLGNRLGKVINFTLDGTTLYIIKLHVQPGFMQAWKTTELTIDRSQIIEVTDTEVVVRSATLKKEDEQRERTAPTPVLDNPFRRAPANNSDHAAADR